MLLGLGDCQCKTIKIAATQGYSTCTVRVACKITIILIVSFLLILFYFCQFKQPRVSLQQILSGMK